MTIIDKDKKSARYVRKPTPKDFNTTYDFEKYWAEERRRWVEGYGGLTGMHYFYLQEGHIKAAEGHIIKPYWRDCDDMIFEGFDKAKKMEWDMLIVKRTEIGLTSIFGGCAPVYHALLNPGSNSLITSADKERMKGLFADKTIPFYDNLHDDFRPEKARTKQDGFLFLAKEDKKSRTFSGLQSKIVCKDTVDNPTGFEGNRAVFGFIDEIFLHPKATTVRSSMAKCFNRGMGKIGVNVMGGTCGFSNVKGIKEGFSLWRDSESKRIVTLFIKGTYGIEQFMNNGHTDEKKAEEYILKRRQELFRAEDKKDYYQFIKDYPLTIEEVFSLSTGAVLPPEVMDKVQKQNIYIMNNPPPVASFDLHRTEKGVVAEPNRSGKFVILEHPQKDTVYISGTDPIPFNTQNIQEGSEYCIAIKKRLAETYVAYYAERSLDVDVVFDRCALLQDYYNKAKTMPEVNAFGAMFQKYKDQGRLDLLAKRPSALGIKFVDKSEAYGYYKNQKTSERGVQLLIKHLIYNADKLFFTRQIKELNDFLLDNTDLLDAMIACEIYDADLSMKVKKLIEKPQFREIRQIVRGENGQTKIEWVKQRIS